MVNLKILNIIYAYYVKFNNLKNVQILVRNSSFVLSTKHVMGWVGLKNSQTQPNLIYPGK